MTRGKIILIDKQNDTLMYHTTCEFNGDMYMEYHGKNIVGELDHIRDYRGFEKFTKYFNDQNFGYDDFRIYDHIVDNSTINVCEDYFDNWFSDYLYFKNISGTDINMVCEIGNEQNIGIKILKNNEIMVLNFGMYVDYQAKLKKIVADDDKEDIMTLYNELGSTKIDELYYVSCIKQNDNTLSDTETLHLARLLKCIYLEDESKRSVGILGDLLMKVKDDITDDMTDTEILELCNKS